MGVVHYISDKLANLVSKMGTDRDKSAHSYYASPIIDDLQLINAYRGSWLPRKIVDIPANDATRNWREWQADRDQIAKIEALEKSLGLQKKVHQALTKARLFGGAAIYISTDDSDPSKPMRENSKIKHLTVLTRRRITPGHMEIDPESENYGEPAYYEISGNTQIRIHPSRIAKFIGSELPEEDGILAQSNSGGNAANTWGWGDSSLTSVIEACKHADGTTANIASLIFEAQVDVIKIPDFMASLSDPAYETAVLERLELAARAKGINGALLLDKEEEYEQKNANFSNLKDILMAFMQIVSGAADIPITRLLGQSATGLNSTGESDIRNYYDSVRAHQELDIGPALARLDDLIIRNALGERPDDISYRWSSLWQSTDGEIAEIGSKIGNMIKSLSDTQLFPEDVLSKAAVNVLTERGVMPGLAQAYDDTEESDPNSEEELSGAMDSSFTDAAPKPLYVARRVTNSDDIKAWARSQGIGAVVDDLHVTIAYSRKPVDWMKVGHSWSSETDGSMRIPPGGPRVVERLGENALVLSFSAMELEWRHEQIVEAGASWDWSEYQPHITITYAEDIEAGDIEPYQGPIVLGPEIFEPLVSN